MDTAVTPYVIGGIASAFLVLAVALRMRRPPPEPPPAPDPLQMTLNTAVFDQRSEVGFEALGREVLSSQPTFELSGVRLKLIQAGIRDANGWLVFLGTQVVCALIAPTLLAASGVHLGEPLRQIVFVVSLLAGFALPSFWLDRQLQWRQTVIANALPDALDLLVACVEAGLALDAALVFVARQVDDICEELADELYLTGDGMSAGVPAERALRELGQRVGLDMLRALIGVLIQNVRYDTDLGVPLRVFAEDMRRRRMNAAEERAASVSSKITFVMVLCFLPCMFLIIEGPAALALLDLDW